MAEPQPHLQSVERLFITLAEVVVVQTTAQRVVWVVEHRQHLKKAVAVMAVEALRLLQLQPTDLLVLPILEAVVVVLEIREMVELEQRVAPVS
jgi:hypothetical protein